VGVVCSTHRDDANVVAVRFAGTSVWPRSFQPQHTTAWSLRAMPHTCPLPMLM